MPPRRRWPPGSASPPPPLHPTPRSQPPRPVATPGAVPLVWRRAGNAPPAWGLPGASPTSLPSAMAETTAARRRGTGAVLRGFFCTPACSVQGPRAARRPLQTCGRLAYPTAGRPSCPRGSARQRPSAQQAAGAPRAPSSPHQPPPPPSLSLVVPMLWRRARLPGMARGIVMDLDARADQKPGDAGGIIPPSPPSPPPPSRPPLRSRKPIHRPSCPADSVSDACPGVRRFESPGRRTDHRHRSPFVSTSARFRPPLPPFVSPAPPATSRRTGRPHPHLH